MVQLFHLPRRRMRLMSTPPQKSAMAPVEQWQPVLKSSGPIPNSAPCIKAADLRALEMSLLLMQHIGPEGISRYVPTGASWGAPCSHSNKQRSAKPTTGQTWRAPLRACPTISPVTPLFCTVSVIPDQSAARNWEALAPNTSNWSFPIYSWMSHHRNGWGSPDVMEHSPGRLRKNTAMYIIHLRQLLLLLFCWWSTAKV